MKVILALLVISVLILLLVAATKVFLRIWHWFFFKVRFLYWWEGGVPLAYSRCTKCTGGIQWLRPMPDGTTKWGQIPDHAREFQSDRILRTEIANVRSCSYCRGDGKIWYRDTKATRLQFPASAPKRRWPKVTTRKTKRRKF